jgi:cytochrome c553
LNTTRTLSLVLTSVLSLLSYGCVSGSSRVASPDAPVTPDVPVPSGTGGAAGNSGAGGSTGTGGTTASTSPGVDGGEAYDATGVDGGESLDVAVPDTNVVPPDTAPSWWPVAFTAGSLPDPSNGNGSHAGSAACGSCHKSGGSASSYVWLFGGIVYTSTSGTTPVASAQIGVKDGTTFVSTYSASNGYFWLPVSAGAINWSTAEIRIRTATGENKMTSHASSGDCQTCHVSGNRVYAQP